jgi:two-component system response regulator MprA
MRVLLMDDDAAVRDSLARTLRFEGHEVDMVDDGQAAIKAVHADQPDAMILDASPPRRDGLETCRQLRAEGILLPIVLVADGVSVGDRVAGLDAGADDYLVKPFAFEELQARLRAVMRRSVQTAAVLASPAADGLLTFADLRLDPITHEVWRGARPIRLTRSAFTILDTFMRHPGQVLTRTMLLQQVWGHGFDETSTSIHLSIGYLRRRLEAGGERRLLHAVRGVGFVLREEQP